MAATETRSKQEQIAWEVGRRQRLAVPTVAAGVLYLLSGIVANAALSGAPTVSVTQGLRPALTGIANPAVSPRAAEIRYFSHHAFGLIAGSVMQGLALVILGLTMAFLFAAARFRRPETAAAARPLVLFGAIGFALAGIAHEVILAITTHNFALGHDFSNHAADQALTSGTALTVVEYLSLLVSISFGVGLAMTAWAAQRVGVVPRMMGIFGVVSGVLVVLSSAGPSLAFIVALWVVALGLLMMGRWPSGDPPAWAAGEARPWPSAAEQRAQREAKGGGRPGRAAPAAATAADAPPEPAAPAGSGGRRRKRKRGPNQRNR